MINLPGPTFDNYEATYSADRIANKEPLRDAFNWRGSLYVCTGTVSNVSEGSRTLKANKMVPIQQWEGRTPRVYPGYEDHTYHGMMVTYAGQVWVLDGERLEFNRTVQGTQHQLFDD